MPRLRVACRPLTHSGQSRLTASGGLFCDGLAWNSLVGIGMYHLGFPGFGAGHDLKARVEIDHHRSKLFQDACVTFHLRGSVRNLRFEKSSTPSSSALGQRD